MAALLLYVCLLHAHTLTFAWPAKTAAPSTSKLNPLFSDFDADPVNFPASPKMFIEQLLALPKAVVFVVRYSETQQQLVSYNLSYQLVAEDERERPIVAGSKSLPHTFDLQNLLAQAHYNICVRASFTPGEFSLYTTQIEKVRNCTVLSTTADAPDEEVNVALIVSLSVVAYLIAMLFLGVVFFKLRNRFCKDRCRCGWLDDAVAACASAIRAKCIAFRHYLLRLGRGAANTGDGASRTHTQTQTQSRNVADVTSTYIAVSQREEASKQSVDNNHTKRFDSDADKTRKSDVAHCSLTKSELASHVSSRCSECLMKKAQEAHVAINADEEDRFGRREIELDTDDANCQINENSSHSGSRQNTAANLPQTTPQRTDDISVRIDADGTLQRTAMSSGSAASSKSQSQSQYDSASDLKSPRGNGSSVKSPLENGSRSPREAGSTPRLTVQNATPSKARKTSKDTLTPSSPIASRQSPSAGDMKTFPVRVNRRTSDRNATSESERSNANEERRRAEQRSTSRRSPDEQPIKSDAKRECPQHGSIILTLNPETMLIGEKKRRRKDRGELVLSAERPNEHERFVRDFYEKLHAHQQNDNARQRTQDTPERSHTRHAGAHAARKPVTPTEPPRRDNSLAKVAYQKQRMSVPVLANDAATQDVTNDVQQALDDDVAVHVSLRQIASRRKANDTLKRDEQPQTESHENKQRKMRLPLDSLDNDHTDDEVWILRASKV